MPRTDGSDGFCPECGKDIDPGERKEFCNPEHVTRFNRRRFGESFEKSEIGAKKGLIGAIQEVRVVIDLLNKGFEVFRAATPSAQDDIWISKSGKLLRIQVKTGHLQTGNIIFSDSTRFEKNCDAVLAIPLDDGEIQYSPSDPKDWGTQCPTLPQKRTIDCTSRTDGRRITKAKVDVSQREINVWLKDGTYFEAPLSQYPVFSDASDEKLSRVCWPYGGRVVRWPCLDFERTADKLFRGGLW